MSELLDSHTNDAQTRVAQTEPRRFNHLPVFYLGIGVLAIFAIISALLINGMNSRIQALEDSVQKGTNQQARLSDQLTRTQSQLQASSAMLGQKLGVTQKQIAQRSAELLRQQKDAEERLSQQQKQEEAKLGAVSEN